MDILPALQRHHYVLRLCAAIENLHIVKLRRIFDFNLRMSQDFSAEAVHGAGIALLGHHQRFAVQILDGQPLLLCQRMLPRDSHLVLKAAQRQEAAAVQPKRGIADADDKVEFLP